MKKIVLIAGYCDLDTNTSNRFTTICDLIDKEHNDVELITSSFNHTKKRQKIPVKREGYKVTYIYDMGYKKNISFARIVSTVIMSLKLKRYLRSLHPDILYCAAPPIGMAHVTLKYCKRRGISMILDVQDLWPEAFEMIANNRVLKIVYMLLRLWIDDVYANATEVFTVSETYSKRADLRRKKAKSKTIYLGIDMNQYKDALERINNRNNSRLKIVYIGTLGHSYDIPTMLYAIEKLNQDNYLFDVIIIGDGPKMKDFKLLKERIRLTNVKFVGRKDYNEMVEIIKDCDIAINPIVKGSAGSVINKACDYAAAGLPVVNSQENEEYRRLLEKYDAGINVKCENPDSMYRGIKKLIDDSDLRKKKSIGSRKMAEELFDRSTIYHKLITTLEEG